MKNYLTEWIRKICREEAQKVYREASGQSTEEISEAVRKHLQAEWRAERGRLSKPLKQPKGG